jgi:CRISPR system Cascade subunit CasA
LNLLTETWIPVRANDGTGPLELIRYTDLLTNRARWRISLPRDDLELACIQLLICMTQIIFLPEDDDELDELIDQPTDTRTVQQAVSPFLDWFDLAHPTRPFMQTRGVVAKTETPIQKLMIGLPSGNNHCFFNAADEINRLSTAVAAIALFHQASNCPSFGGGFKGSLRGGAPITTLVDGPDLREQIWRNVLTRQRIAKNLPGWEPDFQRDRPTWVDPIRSDETIQALDIGLARGLFWQPAHIELIEARESGTCDLLGIDAGPCYTAFRTEKFRYTLNDTWPHPHGAMLTVIKKGAAETKFSSFTTDAPAWTRLTELAVLQRQNDAAGSRPALVIGQARELEIEPLHLLIGGYRNKQASVIERRHELVELAGGWWDDADGRLNKLVQIGLAAKKALRGKLFSAVQGNADKGMEGIRSPIHQIAERMFYTRTEARMLDAFSDRSLFDSWQQGVERLTADLAAECMSIFNELTAPYAMKPELIPIIAWTRRGLVKDLNRLEKGK